MPRAVPVWLAGLGAHLPEHQVTNETIAKITGIDPAWIEERTGITHRFFSRGGERSSALASRAVRDALAQAGVHPRSVELLIVATSFPDGFPPLSTAEAVRRKLGLVHAVVVDINTPLTGFLYALRLARESVASGQSKNAVVVGAEAFSTTCDLTDRRVCYLYSDGAGAMVLAPGSGMARLGAVHMGTGSGVEGTDLWAQVEAAPESLTLYGPRVPGIEEDLSQAFDEVAPDLPGGATRRLHVVSQQVPPALTERLARWRGHLFAPFAQTAYLLSASLPLTLHRLLATGVAKKGESALLFATSGRGTWSATLLDVRDTRVVQAAAASHLERPSPAAAAAGDADREVLSLTRDAVHKLMESEARRAGASKATLSCLTLRIGMGHGKDGGLVDQVDRETRTILKGNTRPADTLVKIEGHGAYAVLLHDVDVEDARRLLARLGVLIKDVDLAGELGVSVKTQLTTYTPGKTATAFARDIASAL